jgi:hypothetical protein
MPPPSLTIREAKRRAPDSSAIDSAISASLSHWAQDCAPQPLNTQSATASSPALTRNVGPMSRIHASFSGRTAFVIAGSSHSSADAPADGSTIIVTGS